MKPKIIFGFVLFILASQLNAQIDQIDIRHYKIDLTVKDLDDTIEVVEDIYFSHENTLKPIVFNLKSVNHEGGMLVNSLTVSGHTSKFLHRNDSLYVMIDQPSENNYYELSLNFKGVPRDGLIIGKNKFGSRTFFGDNWPNRAQNWFACNDHLSDKASVEYIVHTPQKYTVVANGELISLKKRKKINTFHYFSMIPIPTKVMVVGIAALNIDVSGAVEGKLVQSFTYPESTMDARKDLSIAPAILEYYSEYIGPYEFEKLDNVQSTTRFGGMENAGCIFYDENALDGSGRSENLIAHEIAHQWFGNSVTEKDWPELWISEGFATYLANLYLENKRGTSAFKAQLKKDREDVIAFEKKYKHPVLDTNHQELMRLLNPNSYEKGSWILHMLRIEIGDVLFQKCLQNFYAKFRRSNADTKDFQKIVEETCNRNYNVFFNQWLRKPSHPKLQIEYSIDDRKVSLQINQKEQTFSFPLKVEIHCTDGPIIQRTIRISQQSTHKEIISSYPVKFIVIDPEVELLFERVK
jgi:aminopeptidase N